MSPAVATLHRELIDPVPAWAILLGTIIAFMIAGEIGYQLARARRRGDKGESHAGILLGALLGLLGLLLAFSFSMVESRYQQRKSLVLEEANAIGTTYLRADMIPAPHGEQVQELLRRYVEARVDLEEPRDVRRALEQSEELHVELWREADAAAEGHPDSEVVALFIRSLNDLIDLHEERLTVGLYYRLPQALLLSLYVVALISMAVLGYSAGLSRTRSFVPASGVIVAVSVVMLVIIEIDRPWQRVFAVNQQALADVRETMSRNQE